MHSLPRSGSTPVRVSVDSRIATVDDSRPPQLQRITIAINREGRLSSAGLPTCGFERLQPSSTAGALAACRRSLIGEGHFTSKVLLPAQAPYPSNGKLDAFSGTYDGRPAILAHVFGTQPAPTSDTIPLLISRTNGTYRVQLSASLPHIDGEWGYVTGLSMTLGRTFSSHGKRRSYPSATCPAPKGFPGAVFPFARASFAFPGKTLTSILTRTCRARG